MESLRKNLLIALNSSSGFGSNDEEQQIINELGSS